MDRQEVILSQINAQKVERRMRQLRLTRSELADKAGISRGYVSDLLNGRRGGRLGAQIMLSLAKALEVEPLFFADGFANANEERKISPAQRARR